jgi:hypothetical protein
MLLPSGRRYSICVVADSLFSAAVAFRDYCHDPDAVHMNRPRVDPEAILDV